MNASRSLAAVLVAVLVGSIFVATDNSDVAVAATAADFNPGMIISDAQFFDGDSMTAASVQEFLNSQVSTCTSGFTCLKAYHQNTTTKPAISERCGEYRGALNESSATIIYKVGVACGISQKALLVLLQKEQSLVTSNAPTSGSYRSATGYGCPDTAGCDSNYYGFFNQVYMAALQFNRYAGDPLYWNHIAGRVNKVRYHPNASCGTSDVFIQNQATAGLYNYTPYQPNAAALANLYGTGDACSSYGNRNFSRIYTDWFGSTQLSTLLRTTASPKVWLVSGETKHLVPSVDILRVLAPLGGVSYVSQAYLDGFDTGATASRTYRANSGTIYFVDSGSKLPFATCQQVADYGGSCTQGGFVQLTDAQVTAFATGPQMLSVLGTTAGSRYYIKDRVRREVLDDASQTAAGISLGYNVLTEASVARLTLGQPIVRDQVFVRARETGNVTLLSDGRHDMNLTVSQQVGAASRTAGSLNAASIAMVDAAAGTFSGIVSSDGGVSRYILSDAGRILIDGSTPMAELKFTLVSTSLLDLYPELGTVSDGAFVKSSDAATVFLVTPDELRPISSWKALLSLAGDSGVLIRRIPKAVIESLITGAPALEIGGLYRTVDSPKVFAIDGLSSRVPVSSFVDTNEAGLSGFNFISGPTLSAYAKTGETWQSGFICDGRNFVSSAGELREVASARMPLYPMPFIPLHESTCAQMKVGASANEFIRTTDGKIYLLEDGVKRPFTSYGRFVEINSGRGWMQVSYRFAELISTGAAA